MYDIERPWRQQGSFVEPVNPPGSGPSDDPLVCVSFNQEWQPYAIGALMQLIQPSSWDGNDATKLAAVTAATELIELFGDAEVCPVISFRFTDACLLQYSLDGGDTWTDTPGWGTFSPDCFTGPTGDTGPEGPEGPEGPAGPVPPPVPPNPNDDPTLTHACNIASYLAANVIKASLQQAVTDIGSSETVFNTTLAIIALLPGVDIVFGIGLAAAAILFNLVAGGTLSDYSDGLSDTQLWSDVQCAIYVAIRDVGYVDATNYDDVSTALAAVTYTHADVVTAIHDYWVGLTLEGVQAAQAAGSLYAGDCSACEPVPGCTPMVPVVVGANTSYTVLGTDPGVLTMGGTFEYSGVTGPEPNQAFPYALHARPNGTYGAIGFYTSAGSHGLPNGGDNLWVNNVDVALAWSPTTGAWSYQVFGVVAYSGSVGGPGGLMKLEFDPVALTFTALIDSTVLASGVVGAAAYKPVVWGVYAGDVIDLVQICT